MNLRARSRSSNQLLTASVWSVRRDCWKFRFAALLKFLIIGMYVVSEISTQNEGMNQSGRMYGTKRGLDLSFLGSITIWAICIVLHQVASAIVSAWGQRVLYKAVPLPDLGHLVMPNLQEYRWLPEILIHVPLVYAGATALYLWEINGIEHFLLSHGWSMLLRALCFSVTLLPDASQMCTDSVWSGSCHDLIYSGHMVALTLSTMYLWKHAQGLLKIGLIANMAVAALLTIAVRNHYSVDVILALVISPAVSWQIAHMKSSKLD
jgi:hypothetical protein